MPLFINSCFNLFINNTMVNLLLQANMYCVNYAQKEKVHTSWWGWYAIRVWEGHYCTTTQLLILHYYYCCYVLHLCYIFKLQEAPLSPRDCAMRLVNWNLANYHATVQKLLIRQVLTKSMVWSWRFSRRQCVIDNVHSTMTRSSRLPLSQVS